LHDANGELEHISWGDGQRSAQAGDRLRQPARTRDDRRRSAGSGFEDDETEALERPCRHDPQVGRSVEVDEHVVLDAPQQLDAGVEPGGGDLLLEPATKRTLARDEQLRARRELRQRLPPGVHEHVKPHPGHQSAHADGHERVFIDPQAAARALLVARMEAFEINAGRLDANTPWRNSVPLDEKPSKR